MDEWRGPGVYPSMCFQIDLLLEVACVCGDWLNNVQSCFCCCEKLLCQLLALVSFV